MLTTFAGIVVLGTDDRPARLAPGDIYAFEDRELTTPLPVTDLNGIPIGRLESNEFGALPAFVVDTTQGLVWWRSGNLPPQLLMSPEFVVDQAQEAAAAATAAIAQARDARIAAEDAATQAAARGVPDATGVTVGHVLTLLTKDPQQVGWAAPTGGGGGTGYVVLDDPEADPPPGTQPKTLIVTPLGAVTPDELTVMTGPGNVTTAVGTTTADSNLTFEVPANVAVGDLLLLHVASQSGDAGATGWQTPPGWTQVANSLAGGALAGARHHAVYARRITDPAALADLGGQVVVSGGTIPGAQRRAGMLVRVVGAHVDGVVATSKMYGGDPNATAFVLPAFVSPVVAGGVVAYIWCNTSANTGQSDAEMTDAGWVKIGRVVVEGATGAPPAASELIVWWRASVTAEHPAAAGTIAPPSAGGPVGVQYAIRAA